MNNYVTETPSNIRNGLGYKDRPPHEKSEECKRFERELDAELDEIDDSLAKHRDELITERDWLITGWSDALDGWTKAEKRNYELTAERDGLKAQVNSWRERNGGNMAMVDSLAKQVNELNARAERTCRNTQSDFDFMCSECGKCVDNGRVIGINYCPNCGRKVVSE